MNFISLTFVFLFPIVLILYWKLPWKYRELFLLAVSYFFYIKESSWAGGLLLLTTVTTYLAGLAIEKGRHKKGWLIFTVAVCIGFLIGLKYSVPPVGISFYTFQTMAYVIDVYRGEIAAEKNPRSYALFISFFPQLVAGPIERAGNLLGQLKEKHTKSRAALVNGAWLILRGFYKKVVVADYLAVYVDKVYSSPEKAGGIGAVLGTVFFAIQIYCDFSGYSDMAIGIALLLGFHFNLNFNSPYKSASITEFWRRWHISLSSWLRDYLYISLGGNRHGKFRQYLNLIITMFLGGLWHGASWNFVLWGTFHGVALALHKAWMSIIGRKKGETSHGIRRVLGVIITFHFVCFCWIFFRNADFHNSMDMLNQIFTAFRPQLFPQLIEGYWRVFALMAVGFLLHFAPDSWENAVCRGVIKLPFLGKAIVMVAMIYLVIQMKSSEIQPFIYFQF